MNESETRAELIDPALKASGWGEVTDSRIHREFPITDGRIEPGGLRGKAEKADYVLVYRNQKIGIVEAKAADKSPTEGVAQAKGYAQKLEIDYTYSTNGKEIYEISMKTGKEGFVARFPTPEELWKRTFADWNAWKEKFSNVPFEDGGTGKRPRYYQELAVSHATNAVAEEKNRILLTLATGTGKTFIAFQIAWKLFQSRWNLRRDGERQPRILFLADRNILASQAFNDFAAFTEDAKARIKPAEIKKKGAVPKNASVFFTIFQTFMSGPEKTPYFGEYPPDFFDLIFIDECHRGGAQDESQWRGILDYFSPTVQIGLTATPKRKDNADTYRYFGEPVYTYSLKQGINDGFLTPFKVKRIQTTMDTYIYTSDDEIIEGEVEVPREYVEKDFNRIIEIREREASRVRIMMEEINQHEKTLVFCATQDHALVIRDLVNQMKDSSDPDYCVRVTANDGSIGEAFLRKFQDNENAIPTVLTTSQKLSTGVDARNVRNIVLLRPVNSMIEFKQIIGRGTRLFEGKEFFTIYDFVGAYKNFSDPEWDGEPLDPVESEPRKPKEPKGEVEPGPIEEGPDEKPKKLKIKLRDGKEREIQHMISTSFWSADGKPMSVQEFVDELTGTLPEFFKSEEELRKIWSDPATRKSFLEGLAEKGYSKDNLETLQRILDAESCDLLDVLSYLSFFTPKITRSERVAKTHSKIVDGHKASEADFLQFVLAKYTENGFAELDSEKLSVLLDMKYLAIDNAKKELGDVGHIRSLFLNLQKDLYSRAA
ncbi:MAG: DEAD/DEAH box helicase family protein [Bacteroidetes bacterium]|nr:DEAD/DEAH box helicase family protein [Bacteroidota bacterium]